MIFYSPTQTREANITRRSPNITAKQYHSLEANRVGVVSLRTQRQAARFLYAVLSRQRIAEDAERGRTEGEYDKQKGDEAEKEECAFGTLTSPFLVVEKACFI